MYITFTTNFLNTIQIVGCKARDDDTPSTQTHFSDNLSIHNGMEEFLEGWHVYIAFLSSYLFSEIFLKFFERLRYCEKAKKFEKKSSF